jgi:Holliday junction resolvasome RuvABC endonuclease subunit
MAAIDSNGHLVSTAAVKTLTASSVINRVTRYDAIARNVCMFINSHGPCKVLIEGYSFGSTGRGTLDRNEAGGVIRHQVWTHCEDVVSIDELAPTSLQLAVTGYGGGKGKAKKEALKAAVHESFGRDLHLETYDEYDAVGLALVLWWRANEEVGDESL